MSRAPSETAAAPADRDTAVARVVESARELGVELDAGEARAWVDAMASEVAGGELVVDVDTGIYGHRLTMLDFEPAALDRFRAMAPIVRIEDRPPEVTTALAISGSAAQGKINTYPADCDFFQRIHVRAPSRGAACSILARAIRDKALASASGPGYRLVEVKFGTHGLTGTKRGERVRPGSPMSWSLEEIRSAEMAVVLDDGTTTVVHWEDAAAEPGWCKLDWLIADRVRGRVANASNMLDPTWEGSDGSIEPLDGFLDPYFQEVYLEADSIPLFSRLVKELSADAVDDYVEALEHEVWKYTTREPNFGKAARRLYNVLRLAGRYAEAAFIRELFDEPVTALYQVAALIRTLDEAAEAGDVIASDTLVMQVDNLIMSAIQALEGPTESEMVAQLLRLRDSLRGREAQAEREDDMRGVRTAAMGAVNAYFERMLRSVPSIAAYLDDLAQRQAATPNASS